MVQKSELGIAKVVVNRLGHAGRHQIEPSIIGEQAHFMGGVLRVVAADVEEMPDIVRLEHFDDSRAPYIPGWMQRAGLASGAALGRMTDEKGPDEKVLCVPLGDPSFERIRDIHDVNAELRDEIEHFFQRYKDLEPTKQTETRGWGNRSEATEIVVAARARA